MIDWTFEEEDVVCPVDDMMKSLDVNVLLVRGDRLVPGEREQGVMVQIDGRARDANTRQETCERVTASSRWFGSRLQVMTVLTLRLVVATAKIYTVTSIHYLDYGNLSCENVEHRLLQLLYFCVVGISFHTGN